MSKGKQIAPEVRDNIIDDLKIGESWNTIAERYNVSFSTIRRIKKSLEWGGSETVTEDKKIPETALSGETVSEITDDTAFNGIDNDIIPDVPENVKGVEPDCTDGDGQNRTALYSPYNSTVDEAVLERMDKLRENIAELQLSVSIYENELNALEDYHLKYMEAQNNAT